VIAIRPAERVVLPAKKAVTRIISVAVAAFLTGTFYFVHRKKQFSSSYVLLTPGRFFSDGFYHDCIVEENCVTEEFKYVLRRKVGADEVQVKRRVKKRSFLCSEFCDELFEGCRLSKSESTW
jgi:hypothetical protein